MGGAPFLRYFQSKLANAVFTQALHEKLTAKGSKVKAYCADPGMSATSLAGHFPDANKEQMKSYAAMMQSSEDGSMGIITGMMSPDAESGKHYGPEKNQRPRSHQSVQTV